MMIELEIGMMCCKPRDAMIVTNHQKLTRGWKVSSVQQSEGVWLCLYYDFQLFTSRILKNFLLF